MLSSNVKVIAFEAFQELGATSRVNAAKHKTINCTFFSEDFSYKDNFNSGHLERAFCSTFLVTFLANWFLILVIFFLTFLFGNSAAVFVLFYWMMNWENGPVVKKNLLA